MPRISAFYGIAIWMYYDDHSPPHFHATYAEHEAVVEIATRRVLHGSLPARAQRLVDEWAAEHEADLARDWERARGGRPLLPIEPLR